jgi:hypothetical protein
MFAAVNEKDAVTTYDRNHWWGLGKFTATTAVPRANETGQAR